MRIVGRTLTLIFFSTAGFAGQVGPIFNLPTAPTAAFIQLDSSGNIYIAGSVSPTQPKGSSDTTDAFIAKL